MSGTINLKLLVVSVLESESARPLGLFGESQLLPIHISVFGLKPSVNSVPVILSPDSFT